MVLFLIENPKINIMLDTKVDAVEEKATLPESSPEEKISNETAPDGSEPEKTPEEELGSGIKNYDERFKQIYREKKELERKNAELASKTNPVAELKSPETWDEAADLIETRLKTKAEKEEQEREQTYKKINADFSAAKKTFPDLDEDKVFEYMANNKILNVFEAATRMKADEHVSNEANKKVASKVGSSSANSSGKSPLTYAELHRVSLDDIKLPSNK
jgi:vacuolar-type H+-ATPase subunit I/STV1